MPQFPRLLLAISPGNIPPRLPLPTELAHMTYRIGPRCRLLRAYPEQALTGGFLMISGTASSCIGNLDRFCRQVVSECQLRHAAGVIANWELASQCAPLATQLDRALTQAQLEFWVPEYYAGATINAQIFISSQLSGGSLARPTSGGFRPVGTSDRSGNRVHSLGIPAALPLWTGHAAGARAAPTAHNRLQSTSLVFRGPLYPVLHLSAERATSLGAL